jgi:RNA polymerase sigma-70 factor (ECF subfamily)
MDALLARIAVGDQEAMRELYLECRPRLWRYLAHQDGVDVAMLDDLLQEIFVAIWRSAPSYRPQGSPLAWIYSIARHHASHARRDTARHVAHTSRVETDGVSFGVEHEQLAPFENGVLTRLALDDALARLSPPHREVLRLAFQHGFSAQEVAQILDVPLGTVKSRISYARRALIQEYAHATAHEEDKR